MKYLSKTLWLAVCMISIGTLGFAAPVAAQDATRTPLTLNQTVSGTVGPDEPITFTFEAPLTEDVIIEMQSDLPIRHDYTITTERFPLKTVETASYTGGGGSDRPASIVEVIPAYVLAGFSTPSVPTGVVPTGVTRTVEYTVVAFEEIGEPEVDFTLTTHTVAPVRIATPTGPEEPTVVTVNPSEPIQAFFLNAVPANDFAIDIEDTTGTITQVGNYDPIRQQRHQNFRFVDVFQGMFVYSYPQQDDPVLEGISKVRLHYYGGDTYRLIVWAEGPYTLTHTLPVLQS
jgi:hypothetical protein